jgi:hypothetical protein
MFGLTPPVLRIRSDLGIEGEGGKKEAAESGEGLCGFERKNRLNLKRTKREQGLITTTQQTTGLTSDTNNATTKYRIY